VKVPFRTMNYTPGNGSVVTIFKDVKNNTAVDDKIFGPRKVN